VAETGGVAKQWLREEELLGWPEQGYTLQVMGARAETSVRDFIQAQEQPQRFYYFQTVFKGAPWHVVVYGQYADRAAATSAVASLPESLRKLRPWARSIAGVKADIRKK
jgi:septal ring-binding cell division protein DamX